MHSLSDQNAWSADSSYNDFLRSDDDISLIAIYIHFDAINTMILQSPLMRANQVQIHAILTRLPISAKFSPPDTI